VKYPKRTITKVRHEKVYHRTEKKPLHPSSVKTLEQSLKSICQKFDKADAVDRPWQSLDLEQDLVCAVDRISVEVSGKDLVWSIEQCDPCRFSSLAIPLQFVHDAGKPVVIPSVHLYLPMIEQ
jgi:hypothetical protein